MILGLNLGAGLLKPWPLAVIIDSVLGDRAFPDRFAGWTGAWNKEQWLVALSLVVLCLYAAQSLLNTLQNYLIIKTGLHGLERLRNLLFHWMQRMSVRFYQGARQGDLIYRASWDTYSIQVLFQQGFLGLLAPSLSLSLMLLVMGQLSIPLTLVAVSSLPVLLVSMRFFGRQMGRRSLEAHQADSQLTSFVQQTISALALIQSCTQEQHEERRFAQHASSSFRGRLAQHGWEVAYLAVVGILFGIMVAAIVWIGAGQVSAGVITVGQLTIFLAYLAQFYDPLNQLSHLGTTVSDASAGAKRVFEILDTPEEIKESPQARSIIRRVGALRSLNEHESPQKEAVMAQRPLVVQGAIEFDQVVFGYQPDRAVLRSLSFNLRAGESLAIVGPSGAGKSTLLHLMVRFFDPDAGCIKLDGADLRSLKLADLRSQMAYMMQEPLLLPGTVADNVGFGCAEPTIDRLVRACMAAHADDFIRRLPRQYETVIGDGAIRLSAGEKQRLNLARAFLRETPLLLLDEPTSALDADSENLVVDSLHQWMPGHTAFIVTHRPPLVKLAHRVLRLESDGAAHYE
jgi:ATP-binding cassette, subfamily B, bacterial